MKVKGKKSCMCTIINVKSVSLISCQDCHRRYYTAGFFTTKNTTTFQVQFFFSKFINVN